MLLRVAFQLDLHSFPQKTNNSLIVDIWPWQTEQKKWASEDDHVKEGGALKPLVLPIKTSLAEESFNIKLTLASFVKHQKLTPNELRFGLI